VLGRLGRGNTRRSGALGKVGELFGRQETKHGRTAYRGPAGLGILGALAVVATVSVVLILRRRAARRGSPVEESDEEAIEANEKS